MSEQRITWFRSPDRPVGGGGNTVWVKPSDPQPQWWGTNPSPELDRLIAIFHDALFVEDDERGPMFRFATDQQLFTDDDPYLGCTPDQMAFAVLDRADEVTALIAAIRTQWENQQ